jgi:hypothetical protein
LEAACLSYLDNVVQVDECLLWQGAVNDKGIAVAKLNGLMIRIHRLVKLYECERSEEQIDNLRRLDVSTCKRFTHCINPKHTEFLVRKEPKKPPADMADWRKVYGTDLHGLA